MGECLLVMTDKGYLLPIDDGLSNMKMGDVIRVKFSFARNPMFHRKMFALLKFACDALPDPEPIQHRGITIYPERDFDTNRKFFIVQAGFYDVIGLPNGEVRTKAKSLSYASMDNKEFSKVYSAVINVVLKFLPFVMSAEELDASVNNLMGFA